MQRLKVGYPERNEKLSDVVLVSNDGEKFCAHKVILARYPYFSGVVDAIADGVIHLPYSAKCTEYILEIIYGEVKHIGMWMNAKIPYVRTLEYKGENKYTQNHPTLKNPIDALDLLQCMDYIGLYFDELFEELFYIADFIFSKQLLKTYGLPEYITKKWDGNNFSIFISMSFIEQKCIVCLHSTKFAELYQRVIESGGFYHMDFYAYMAVRYMCDNRDAQSLDYLNNYPYEKDAPVIQILPNLSIRSKSPIIHKYIIKLTKKILGSELYNKMYSLDAAPI
jgi:hypothetical protein